MTTNLELMTLRDLFRELEKRYTDFVFAGQMRYPTTKETTKIATYGAIPTCLGLGDLINDDLWGQYKGNPDNQPDNAVI